MSAATTADGAFGAFPKRPLTGALVIAALLIGLETAARLTAGAFIIAGPLEIALHLWTHAGLIARALAADPLDAFTDEQRADAALMDRVRQQ